MVHRADTARRAAAGSGDPFSPWQQTNGWRLNSETHSDLTFLHGEQELEVRVIFGWEGLGLGLPGGEISVAVDAAADGAMTLRLGDATFRARVLRDGLLRWVILDGRSYVLSLQDPLRAFAAGSGTGRRVLAPMPGKVTAVLVSAGDKVSEGAPLLRLEAMKMEHTLTAPYDGVIEALNCAAGDLVEEGFELAEVGEA